MTATARRSAIIALFGLLAGLVPVLPAWAGQPALSVADVLATAGGDPVDVTTDLDLTASDATDLMAVVSVPAGHGSLAVTAGTGVSLLHGYAAWSGVSEIGFDGPAAGVESTLESLRWTPPAGDAAADLSVSVTESPGGDNTFYSPDNGRYYEYVQHAGAAWTTARDGAAGRTLFGMAGYLVTITSASENDFVARYTPATNIWIGASDKATEGTWQWATGPEAGTTFWHGADGGTPAGEAFNAWASGEPNDANGEDYAVTNWGGAAGRWNDYESTGNISGYLVEYGEMAGDTPSMEQASATASLTAATPRVAVGGVTTAIAADAQVDVDVTHESLLAGELVAVVSVDQGTLSVGTDGVALSLEYGYDSFLDRARIGFRGSVADVVTAVEQQLTWHAPATAGDATVKVSLTERISGDVFIYPDAGAQGAAYEYVTGAIAWTDARAAAAARSLRGATGQLATMATEAENDFVADHVDAQNIWIGASDAAAEGVWRWIDGSSVATWGWASGEPNNWGGNEHYAVTNWKGSRGAWNDLADGHTVGGYLVEYDVAAMDLFQGADTGAATATSSTPGAPTGVQVDARAGQLTLSWTAPEDDGGSALASYEVSVEAALHTCASDHPTTTCTVTGLTDGTEYRIRVTATNVGGQTGPASAEVVAAPIDASIGDDGRPAAGPGQTVDTPIRVTLPADRAGKLNIPHGRLSRDAGATDPKSVTVVVPAGLGPCIEVDPTLVPDGVAVVLSDTLTAPMRAHVAGPEHLVAKALDDRAVWWNPDCDGSPDDASDAGGTVDTTVSGDDSTIAEGPLATTDLAHDLDAGGTGSVGLDLVATTGTLSLDDGRVPPGVSTTADTTESGHSRVRLDGREDLVRQAIDDGAASWGDGDDGTSTTATLTTTIRDAIDVSARHATARLALPDGGGSLVFDAPSHPEVDVTTAHDGALVLSGPSDPTDVDADGVGAGAIEQALAHGVRWKAPQRAGLYDLAVELHGDGGYATRIVGQLEVSGVPSAPRALTGTRTGTTLTVRWEAPETAGSAAVTAYDVTAGAATCQVVPPAERRCDFADVTGAPIALSATATNAEGVSAPATATVAWPDAPRGAAAWAATPSSATVTWNESIDAGTATITGYTARNVADPTQACTAGPTARECTVAWLATGSDVTFEVLAHSAAGDSDPAMTNRLRLLQSDVNDGEDIAVAVGHTDPVPVRLWTDLPGGFGDGTGDEGTITAELLLPGDAGSLQVDEALLGGAILAPAGDDPAVVLTGTPEQIETALQHAIGWVPSGLAGTYGLEADLAEDGGDLTTRLGTWLRIVGPPAPPSVPTADRSGTTVAAGWQPPARDGGSALATYTARVGSTTCSVAAPARGCDLTGIPTTSTVTVEITVTNADGHTSAAATVVSPGTGGGTTDQPHDPVRDGDGSLPHLPPGGTDTTLGGQPATTAIEADGDRVTVIGDGFSLDAQPTRRDGQPSGTVRDTRMHVPASGGIRIQTRGFLPGSQVSVWLFSEPTLLGTLDVEHDGTLDAAMLLLPDGLLACAHTLQVIGTIHDGRDVVVSMGVWVTADPFPFGDTDPTGVHGPAIGCLESRGVVRGYGGGPYRPGRDTSRGEAASMIARILGLDTSSRTPVFPDTDGAHASSIAALVEARVIAGYPDGTFRPEQPLSRGQLAALMVRAAGLAGAIPSERFTDVDDGPLGDAVHTAAANGLVAGFGDGTFRPAGTVSRGGTASMLERLAAWLEQRQG